MHIYSSNESLSCVNHVQQVSLQRVTGFGEGEEEGEEEEEEEEKKEMEILPCQRILVLRVSEGLALFQRTFLG